MHKILLPRIIQSGILGDRETCIFQFMGKFMARKELLVGSKLVFVAQRIVSLEPLNSCQSSRGNRLNVSGPK